MEKNSETKSSSGPKGSWFRMPSEVTLSSELNPYQYRVLAVLLERANLFKTTRKLNTYWSSIGWITSHSGMGETKMRETLNELEEMGFISITRNGTKHKENTFHINWDFINTYQRPKTQQELEKEEDTVVVAEPSTQEKHTPVAPSTSSSKKRSRPGWSFYSQGPLDWMYSPYYIRTGSQQFRDNLGMPIPLPERPLPAAEWYNTSGRQFVRDTYFHELMEMEQSGKDLDDLRRFIYTKLLLWVMPCVTEEDDIYVWEQVIKPDFEEYKREQTLAGRVSG